MKALATSVLFLVASSYALTQPLQFNNLTNCFEPTTKYETQSSELKNHQSSRGAGIVCDSNTFWSTTSSGQIEQFALNGTTISSLGIVNIALGGSSLAYCNNLNGGAYSPTFYTSKAAYQIFYYNGTTWPVIQGNGASAFFNASGNGNHLYYTIGTPGFLSRAIVKYNGGGFDTVSYDPNLYNSVADHAVDDSGNLWCFKSINYDSTSNYIDVISPSGQLLKRYNISLSSYHAYGCFMLNKVLYVALGSTNTLNPNSLIPFSFTADSAVMGTPFSFPYNSYADLESCNKGAPLSACSPFSLSITASTNNICASDSAHVCAPSTFTTYHWSNGQTDSCITTNLAGNYNVSVTDNNGCTAESNQLTILVNPVPTVEIAADTNVVCASDSVLICAPTIYVNYLWNNGSPDQCITTSLAGNYYVTVTDVNGCTAESNHLSITVYPLPPVAISVNGDTLSVYGAVTQQWYLNGSAINGATAPIYIATQSGSYTVAVTDTNGCVATSSAVIISGVDNLSEEDVVSVYQLTDGGWQLTVGNNWLGGEAEVFDANGRVVFGSLITNHQSLITPALSRGVYLLRISSSKSRVVRKLVRL